MIWKVHEKEKYTNLVLVACWSTSKLAIGKKFTEEERVLQRVQYIKTACLLARIHLRMVVWYLHTCMANSSRMKKIKLQHQYQCFHAKFETQIFWHRVWRRMHTFLHEKSWYKIVSRSSVTFKVLPDRRNRMMTRSQGLEQYYCLSIAIFKHVQSIHCNMFSLP